MNSALRNRLAALAHPLALASYAAWLAVWLSSPGILATSDPGLLWPARWLLLGFLGGWLLSLSAEPGERRRRDLAIGLMALAAFGLVLLGRSTTSPILLMLLACALGDRLGGRALALALFLVSVGVLATFLWVWQWRLGFALVFALSFTSLQVFGALVVRQNRLLEQMAEDLKRVNGHLLATRSLLAESARDQERLRLSRELHDVAGHKLTALKLNLRTLRRDAGLGSREELALASQLADELLTDIRGVVSQLRQHDGMALEQALRRLAEPWPRPRIHLELDAEARVPGAEQADTLVRVAQEALTNAARHGGASDAWLRLARDQGGIALMVEDNGRVQWPLNAGNGLKGMRERLDGLGGRLDLEPSSRGGLRVAAWLPLAAAS